MKKLIISLNPDMYNQYAGLQAHLDFLAVAVAIYNFKFDEKSEEAMFNICSSSDLLLLDKKDDDNYVIIHKYHKVTLGTITRIMLQPSVFGGYVVNNKAREGGLTTQEINEIMDKPAEYYVAKRYIDANYSFSQLHEELKANNPALSAAYRNSIINAFQDIKRGRYEKK